MENNYNVGDEHVREYMESVGGFQNTGFSYTMSLIAGKYKMGILYCIFAYQPIRFNILQRYMGNISDKTLSKDLKELAEDGLIHKEVYPQIPPKVEYTLTPKGYSLMEVLRQLCVWGIENRD